MLRSSAGLCWDRVARSRYQCRIVTQSRPRQPSRSSYVTMASAKQQKPVLLFDVMDTIVYDPFFKDMPKYFGMSFEDLLKAKHPTAWVEFECNRITEEDLFRSFFADGRAVDGDGLLQTMKSAYRYLDGMEMLLGRLRDAGYEMHALSNYPMWYRYIEDKLQLSQYLQWTFVSCTGPMEGVRKPAKEAYDRAVVHLGLPPQNLLFIDDRQVNITGASEAGLHGVLFKGAGQLEQELKARGLEF